MIDEMKLTKEEREALASLEDKQNGIRCGVVSLLEQMDTGFFIFGRGGGGKSYIVEDELQRHLGPKGGADYEKRVKAHAAHVTGPALVGELSNGPSKLHWFEDCEPLFADKKALGLLRSALYSQSKAKPMVRPVTYRTARGSYEFDFTGSICVINNAPILYDIPELQAIATRVKILNINLEDNEILALAKKLCLDGYKYGTDKMSPEDCWRVYKEFTAQIKAKKQPLNLRVLNHCFKDYILKQIHPDLPHTWQQMVATRIQSETPKYQGRKEKAAELKYTALAIRNDPKHRKASQQVAEWTKRTGMNKAQYYRYCGKGR